LKTKASSEQIKTLAQTLGGAQEEENRHLARLAAAKGWNVSLEPTAEQKKEGAAMDKLTGANFDKAAMDKILAASHAALTAYETAAQSSDPNVKTFASQMLPLAEEKGHLVEKMTGAGSKTAGQLFRHNVAEQTPSPAPAATPAKGRKGKATPTPPASAIPVATPPGTDTPPKMLPPIVPPKGGPTPTLPQATPIPAPTPSKQGAG
jgi:predicted outer membrane protein